MMPQLPSSTDVTTRQGAVAEAVPVIHLSREHVCDDLDAAMRCQGKPARYSSGLSLRKSSKRRNGSNLRVAEPEAALQFDSGPSSVGCASDF
jgi:hypothetical protein